MVLKKNFKIGIIGCGYWAANILNSLKDLGQTNIYVFDKDKDKSKILKKRFNFIKIINSLTQIVNDQEIDCFFLVTPASTHYVIGKKILKKGKDLFIEKPATTSIQHLTKLSRIAKKKGTILMIGYVYIFNPYIQFIKRAIKKNILGKIKYIYYERCNLGPIRNDTSCIWDLSSHDISTTIYLLDKIPKFQNAQIYNLLNKKNADICNVILKVNKVHIEIKSSWIYPEKTRKLIIIGEKKMLQFDELLKGKEIQIYNKYAKYPNVVKKFSRKIFKPGANISIGKTYIPKINFYAPLMREIQHFLNCVKKKEKPKTNASYALEISKIITDIERLI